MGRQIDERVVQMKFENGQFERGVQTSIKTVQELKKGLDFEDSIKGFEKLDKASQGLKLDALISAVDKLNSRFSLVGETIRRIENQAISMGKNLISSLSTDQISVGWDKFASKTTSVQTIMAATAGKFSNTAEQMAVVNEQLDKLNWFTDETSYNFVDMVNNIGKFTSNNIDLDKSVTAMQGIANWAAISGANANEASRAMYNISQALATGSVKLIDWKSIENANMATAEFKKTVIEMAAAEGTLVKKSDTLFTTLDGKVEISTETFNGFNDSLQKGWFNTEVLMKSLNKYGGATDRLNQIIGEVSDKYNGMTILTSDLVSGIDAYTDGTKTAEEISKDWGISLEDTQRYLEEFSDETMQFGLKAFKAAQEAKTFQDAIDSVKDAVSTGWMKSFELIFGDYMQAKEFWTEIANTLYDIFAESGNARNEMLAEWNKKGGRNYFIDSIYASFALLLSIMNPLKAAWQSIFTPMDANRLFNITKALRDLILKLVLTEETQAKLARTARGLFAVLDILKTVAFGGISKVFKLISALAGQSSLDILEFTARIGDFLYAVRNWVKEQTYLNDAIDFTIDKIALFVGKVKEFIWWFKDLPSVQAASRKGMELFNAVLKDAGSFFRTAIDRIKAFIKGLRESKVEIKSWGDVINIFKRFKSEVIDGLFSVESVIPNVKNAFEGLKTSLLAVFGDMLKNIPELGFAASVIEKLFSFLSGGVFGTVSDAFKVATGVIKEFVAQLNYADVIVALVALGIFQALKKVTGIFEIVENTVGAITDTIGIFGKAWGKYMKSKSMVNYATSVLILVGALAILTNLDYDKLWVAVRVLGYLAVGMLVFAGSMAAINSKLGGTGSSPLIQVSISILAIATAVLLLAKALDMLNVNAPSAGSLGTLAILVGGLAAFCIAMKKFSGEMKDGSRTILAFAAGILLLTVALKSLGKLDTQTLSKGFVSLTVLLGIFGVAMAILTKTNKIAVNGNNNKVFGGSTSGVAAQILAFAVSVHIIIAAFKSIDKLKPETILKGLAVVGAIFIEFGVLSAIISRVGKGGALGNAGTTVLAMSVAINLIIPAIKALAKLEEGELWSAIAKLGVLGLVFVAAIAASKLAGENAHKAGAMLLEMALAMAILPIVIRAFGGMDETVLKKGLIAFTIIGVVFSLAIAASAKAENAKFAIIAMGGIIAILGYVIFQLAQLDPRNALASAGGLTMLLLSLAASFKILASSDMRLSDEGKALGGLYLMAGVVAILAEIIAVILKDIGNPTGVVAAAGGISLILLAMAASMRIMNKMEPLDNKVLKQLGIMTAVVGGLAIIVALLSAVPGLNTGQALVMVAALTLLIGVVIGAYAAIGGINKIGLGPTKAMIDKFKTMAIIVGALAAVIAVMSKITSARQALGTSQVLVLFIAELVGIFTLFSAAMSKIRLKKDAITQFYLFSAMLIPISVIISKLAEYPNIRSVVAAASSLSAVLLALSGAMAILAVTKVKFDPGLAGQFLIFEALMGVMGLILVGLGALADSTNLDMGRLTVLTTIISVMLPLLASVVSKLAVVSLIAGNALPGIIALGAGMDVIFALVAGIIIGFGVLINEFEAVGNALEVAPHYCILLGEAIGGLLGGIIGGVVEGIGQSLLNLLPALGTALSEFGQNIEPFFAMVSGLEDGLLGKVGLFAGVIVALTAAEFLSAVGMLATGVLKGIADIFGVSTDPTKSFKEFGSAIAAFAKSIKGVNSEQVKNAAEAAGILGALNTFLPGEGGVLEYWLGKKDIGAWGERLGAFGKGLKAFADETGDIDASKVENAAKASELLIDLEKNVPARGGKLQEFLGQSDIENFGTRLKSFGESLKEYVGKVSGITKNDTQGSYEAAKMLVELESKVPASDGMLQEFFGAPSFDQFGFRLESLGESLVEYIKTTSGITKGDIEGSAAAIQALSEVEAGLTATGGAGAFLFGEASFSQFGKNLIDLGEALDEYDAKIDNVDAEHFAGITEALAEMVNLSKLVSDSGSWSKNLKDAINSWINSLAEDLSEQEDMIYDLGKDIPKLLANGVSAGLSEQLDNVKLYIGMLCDGVKTAIDSAFQIVSNVSNVMYAYGEYIVAGLIKAFEDERMLRSLQNSSANLAIAVDEAFRAQAEIHSPSAVMEENGVWLVKGIAEGIKSDMSAEEAMEKKAQNIVSAFQKAIDQSDLYKERDQLMFQLWEANEGRYASDGEKQAHNIEAMVNELGYMASNVQKYRGALVTAAKEFGEGSDEYVKAENKMNKAILEMYQQRNKIEEAQAKLVEGQGSQVEKAREYGKLMQQEWVKDFQKQMEMTDAELQEWAKDQTGWTREVATPSFDLESIMAPAFSDQQVKIVQESISSKTAKAVSGGLQEGIENADPGSTGVNLVKGLTDGVEDAFDWFGKDALDTNLGGGLISYVNKKLGVESPSKYTRETGKYLVEGLTLGIEKNAYLATNAADNAGSGTINAFKKVIPEFSTIGRQTMEGFTRGLQIAGQQAIQSAQKIAQQVASSMKTVLSIHSPSRVTAKIGEYVSLGLAKGITDNANAVTNASEDLATNTISMLDYARSAIDDVLSTDDDFEPMITPVLNMDDLKKQARNIPGILNRQNGISTRLADISAQSITRQQKALSETRMEQNPEENITNINYTQNNYSPKALNRREIYRQTNNQISQLKGVIRR